MDVPFISSGALNRAHYSLVRKVESSVSTQAANQHIVAEVKSIRRQLAQPTSLESYRQYLIILLFCHTTLSNGVLAGDAFEFALTSAISLAEAGKTIAQKRIGYLYCAEVMPPHHELQLMLVNTLRKDLEDNRVTRICLALDMIITSPSEELVPAVQDRLLGLLSHNSPQVRRRVLTACRVLARNHRDLSMQIGRTIIKRLNDPDTGVVRAALTASLAFEKLGDLKSEFNHLFERVLESDWKEERILIVTLLQVLKSLGVTEKNILPVLDLVHSSSLSNDYTLLQESFHVLSGIPSTNLLSFTPSLRASPIADIRTLLVSPEPNLVYLFLSCIECLDPPIWAGTASNVPAILEGWEVERIMQLLDSQDGLIRRKTLRVLDRVDPSLVISYKLQVIAAIPHSVPATDSNECALRLLEIVDVQSGHNGELYAHEARDLLLQMETATGPSLSVLETAVESILLRVRDGTSAFRIACATALVTFTVEIGTQVPQTMVVIGAALATEFCGQLAIAPLDVVKGLVSRLPSCLASVQDACILSMLRVAAECPEIPSEIVSSVLELGAKSTRHIRKRCEQFATLIKQKPLLSEIVGRARSSSLPDFLAALMNHSNDKIASAHLHTISSSTQSSTGSGQLRYRAYDAPVVSPKLRIRRSKSSHSESSQVSSSTSPDPLSRTLTPGQLATAAAAGSQGLDLITRQRSPGNDTRRQEVGVDHLESRMDLISLDSPFALNQDFDMGRDFEEIWNKNSSKDHETRGWAKLTMDDITARLQGMEVRVIGAEDDPFKGDLKVVIGSSGALRLRESPEGGCLWRLRCVDKEMAVDVRRMIGEESC